jgi:murein tripeptide amidase MpaA
MKFLNVVEIESALVALNSAYPALTQLITLPNTTYEGRTSNALLIRGNASFDCRPALVLVSGVHAREWGGPDIIVNLATDLLEAYSTNAGLAYGNKSFSAATIQSIVNRTDVVVFPDLNPDGRAYSMAAKPETTQACWRKNRNPASSGGDPLKIGVDVNRNYDFLWNFPVTFAPGIWPASNFPEHDTFFGTGPFSEAESRNVLWLIDLFANARYFVDVHSYSGLVLHPWGDDQNQTTNASMSFMNAAWNGQRGIKNDTYRDYLPVGRLAELQTAATVMRDGIFAVRGESYVAQQGFLLYPTSGTSEDWAFTREFLVPSRGRLNGFVIEFNKNIDFFPTWKEMVDFIADIDAGLIALCAHATPSWFAVIWCWIKNWFKKWFWAIWKRVWPWELWGPYGPWGRIRQVIGGIPRAVVRGAKGVLGRVAKIAGSFIGRGRGG